MKEKVQFNVRIDANLRKSHKMVAEFADTGFEEMTEAALRFFYGSKDSDVLSIRERALSAAKVIQKGIPLPFNAPLTRGDHVAVLV